MSDIFGNLDNFLENYDDNCLDASIDGEALNGSISVPSPVPISKSRRKSKLPKAGAAEVQTSKEADVVVPCSSAIQQPTVVEVLPAVAEPTIAATVDLSGCPRSDLDEKMQELYRMYNFIFLHKNPVVEEKLRMEAGSVSVIKRSFNSLKTAYETRKPIKGKEIDRLLSRLNLLKAKLNQLHSDIQILLMDVNPNTTTATRSNRRRRNQPLLNPVCPADVITITLDPDDTPGRMPLPSVPSATIDLDSDNEEPPLTAAQMSASFEAENYQMRIKVKWGTTIETFDHRRHQKFADIMAKLAAREKADTNRILLNIGDRIIYADDTPDTINYKTFQFISGRILKEKAPTGAKNGPAAAATASKAGLITLKLQLEKRKEPLQIRIEKTQTMAVVIVKCAEELKCKPTKIRLYFDGDMVNSNSKPDDLELEGDEVLDVRLVD
ncbi:uncharacterized protein LOC125956557 [Anopheles darlingi]|uniref:uncharacterized protein LOC125956557 n=1 Tax=Anopheles darlingi TaxID=43151 RepID=UPI0021005444|nr:uncharacterized protein LOC125956557 [Anopheles darlingi]